MKPEDNQQRFAVETSASRDFRSPGFPLSHFRLPTSDFPLSSESGSTLTIVMIFITVLSVVAGSLLLTNMARYQTTFQSASWQESIVASEAGVDLAMNELRKRVVIGPSASFQNNWTTTSPRTATAYPQYGRAFPANGQPYQLVTHSGEGNNAIQVRVFVDVPGADVPANFAQTNDTSFISQIDNPGLRDPDGVDRSRWLFRIKSLGITGLSGPPRPNLNKYDNELRRFSFFNDWRTGLAVPSPQAARMVEAVAAPQTGFRNALMADKQINLNDQDVLIDSYDSSKGNYSSTTNHGQMGNIATNGQLINASHATVNGNAMTNNGTVDQGDKVTGQQSSNFYQELTPLTSGMLNPAWSTVKDGGTVSTNTTYTASPDASNPTLVRLDGINLPDGGRIISINAPSSTDSGAQSYIKLYVQGDVTTAGSSYVNLAAGVNAIIYVTGNVTLKGNGIINNSYMPGHLVLNGVQPPANADGTYPARTVTVATAQDFQGVVYAPNHDLDLALTVVPVGGTLSIPVVLPVTDPKTLQKIADLNNQILNQQNDILNQQNDYAAQVAKYNKNGDQGAYKKMQEDLQRIADDQTKINTLQAQIDALQGTTLSSSAEDHARGYNGIYGGFVARTITVESKTHIHYDETLRTAGPVNHYEIVNWFEDNVSRDAAGGAETFWWPAAH